MAPNAVRVRMAGLEFINGYYHVLLNSPQFLHKFYRDCSLVTREGPNGLKVTGTTVTNPQIKFPFSFPEYSGWKVLEIKTVDSQESQSNGVLVLVGGSVTFKNNETVHTFSQIFFLAPQENGYFVLNDIFKLVA